MKPTSLQTGLAILICGAGLSSWGALRPEGDKIEFSPPREELKVPPLTGSDPAGPSFGFQRREPGSSVSDVPSAVALPSPDQVNRMRALQELIEQRSAWARPEGLGGEMSLDPDRAAGDFDTEISIDDLFERQNGGANRGFQKTRDLDSPNADRNRDDNADGASRDRRGPNSRDARDRRADRDRDRERDSERGSNSLTDTPLAPGETDREGTDSARKRRDGMGPTQDSSQRDRRGASGGLFEFGSLVPRPTGLLKDSSREMPTSGDRMESLRRVLGSSAPSILGPTSGKPGSGDGVGGAGLYGTLGGAPGPGSNRGLSQNLDSRSGASVTTPTAEGPGSSAERLTSAPNRPFGLDLTTGREGYSSRSDRMQLAPISQTPMEMFRKKHDARIPTRDF